MPSRSRSRLKVKLAFGAVALFAGAQLVRPEVPNPPVIADLAAPPEVKSLLVTACYDCHSNETRLRWFDRLAPASWLVARDVRTGREHLDFSNFGVLPAGRQRGKLYEALNQIEAGVMPPAAYRWLHPQSALGPEQLNVLENYLHGPEPLAPATSAQVASATAQYETWLTSPSATISPRPAPNGIAFSSRYKDWQVISVTDRFDDHRFRAILANDVGERAIAANQTNPWPDGTVLAKVAWDELVESDGTIRMGEFRQVAFMFKNAAKYAATQGWGYAQWVSAQLEPYGKDADFVHECTGCHAPMREHDFVFTVPVARTSVPAAWRLITSAIDPRNATMSQVYGNDVAVEHARHAGASPYPPESALSRVVWEQRPDPRWFGGRIPSKVKSVESLVVTAHADDQDARSQSLLQQRAAVLP